MSKVKLVKISNEIHRELKLLAAMSGEKMTAIAERAIAAEVKKAIKSEQ